MTPVQQMLALADDHDINFHNVPVVDRRPDIANRKTSRSYFSHPKWGELDIDTSNADESLAALQAWIERNTEPESLSVDDTDMTVKPKAKKKAKKK